MLEGHAGFVITAEFSPDGTLALSGGGDRTARLWDLATGRELRTFSGHRKPIWSVAFTPDGKHALSAGYDEGVKVWDVATGREITAATPKPAN